jgi:hypothetical protein
MSQEQLGKNLDGSLNVRAGSIVLKKSFSAKNENFKDR